MAATCGNPRPRTDALFQAVFRSLHAALTITSATAAGAWTMLSMPGLASTDTWLAGGGDRHIDDLI
jgi:hypothetical protein